jgi:hypothetical protein
VMETQDLLTSSQVMCMQGGQRVRGTGTQVYALGLWQQVSFFFFKFWWDWGLNRDSCLLSRCSAEWTPPVHFALISRTICPGWPWTLILLISVSQVGKITGVNPLHSARTN